MSLRHSSEHLPVQNACTICRENLSERDDVLVTACSHRFHRNCLMSWLKRNSSCPQCRATCSSRDFHSSTGARTRSCKTFEENTKGSTGGARNLQTAGENVQPAQQQQTEGATCLPVLDNETVKVGGPSNGSDEDARVRNLVSAIVSARHASIFDDLENRMTQMIEQRLESTLTNLLERVNLNPAPPAPPSNDLSQAANTSAVPLPPNVSTPRWPRDIPPLPNQSQLNFNNQIDQIRLSDVSSIPNSSRLAQLISSWDLKFDGTSRLSVDSFLSRIELLVIDTLGGNFNLLCEHAQSLFVKEAKDWYWRYRRSVQRVTWPSLCQALRTNFQQHKSDFEVKEAIRARKQGPNESFDDFRNGILKNAEPLQTPLSETELVEIMQHNLRPQIRQQLLFVPIASLAELRRHCLRGESLANEITNTAYAEPSTIPRQVPRRHVNEMHLDPDVNEEPVFTEVEEISKRASKVKLTCWNCNKEGHRYFDCLEGRSVFCYGCGAANVYRPKCSVCNPGNSKRSEEFRQIPRDDSNH